MPYHSGVDSSPASPIDPSALLAAKVPKLAMRSQIFSTMIPELEPYTLCQMQAAVDKVWTFPGHNEARIPSSDIIHEPVRPCSHGKKPRPPLLTRLFQRMTDNFPEYSRSASLCSLRSFRLVRILFPSFFPGDGGGTSEVRYTLQRPG